MPCTRQILLSFFRLPACGLKNAGGMRGCPPLPLVGASCARPLFPAREAPTRAGKLRGRPPVAPTRQNRSVPLAGRALHAHGRPQVAPTPPESDRTPVGACFARPRATTGRPNAPELERTFVGACFARPRATAGRPYTPGIRPYPCRGVLRTPAGDHRSPQRARIGAYLCRGVLCTPAGDRRSPLHPPESDRTPVGACFARPPSPYGNRTGPQHRNTKTKPKPAPAGLVWGGAETERQEFPPFWGGNLRERSPLRRGVLRTPTGDRRSPLHCKNRPRPHRDGKLFFLLLLVV